MFCKGNLIFLKICQIELKKSQFTIIIKSFAQNLKRKKNNVFFHFTKACSNGILYEQKSNKIFVEQLPQNV